MTEYEEIMNRLTEMRGRYDSGFSSSDRSYIGTLYRKLLSKTIRRTGCADCYRDAYIETFTYLKKIGTMPTKPNYILKAGVVVHPKGTNQFYANANIPDEIAEKHLAEFPNAIVDFQSYPSDYLARVEARKNGEPTTPVDTESLTKALKDTETRLSEATDELKAKTEELDIAKTELAAIKVELEEKAEAVATSDDGALAIEVETLKADLEAANAEIASLKADLEKAKSASSKKSNSKSAA